MSTSKHQIQVRANDQTAAGFKSIKDRAAATGNQINSMLRGAITAAAGYLSFRTVHNGIQELGHLSDVAMKAGTSVEELTKMETALGQLGIQGMNVESLATAFKYMEKTTGRQGMQGFYETIAEIAKIPDASKRGEEAMRVFSRAGLNFIPLINAAENGTEALENVVNAMPGISDSAANAGDATADALGLAMAEIKAQWLNGLGGLCEILGGSFSDGVGEGSAIAVAKFVGKFKAGVIKLTAWMHEQFSTFFDELAEGWDIVSSYVGNNAKWLWNKDNGYYSWGDAAADAADASIARRNATEATQDLLRGVVADVERETARRVEELRKLNEAMALAAKANGRDEKTPEKKKEEVEVVKRASRAISNSLMMAGSAEALKLQMLGPRTEAEQKKQTKLLEKIEKNTAETAESGEDVEVALS